MPPQDERTDAQIDLKEHHGGPTDPTGHVTSGLQGGPLRRKGGRPVADPDEGLGETPRERDLSEENVTRRELREDAETPRKGSRRA